MFKYGVGHDGKRPAVRGGKKGNIVGKKNDNDETKKARRKKKGRAGKRVKVSAFQYSHDERNGSKRLSDDHKTAKTRIRIRVSKKVPESEGTNSPSISRVIMKSNLPKTSASNTNIVNNSSIPATPPTVPTQTPNIQSLSSKKLQQHQQHNGDQQKLTPMSFDASRIGWTKTLDNDFNQSKNARRRKITGEALRIPSATLNSFSKRKRRLSPTNNDPNNQINDVIHNSVNDITSMAHVDAATLNLSSFASGSILLSKNNNNDNSNTNSHTINNNIKSTDAQKQPNNPNVIDGLGQAIFVLPRGVIPGGASNGSTFTLLSRINADVQWVENACKENSDFHLWDRFIALQVHGPYELVKNEAYLARSATGAYMSLPFAQVDSRWLHFYRLFLSSIRKPTHINLRQDAILMTNGVLIHKMRAGDTSMTQAAVAQPRPLKSRIFKKLIKFGLDENDVLLELLMRTSTIRSVEINYSGELTKSLADLLQTNPRLESVRLNSHFPFDRLSGVALGLSALSKALDSSNGGTARLVSLSLLASCSDRKYREMHKQCLVHLLANACPKCETLNTIEIIKSKRKTSPVLLPALGVLVRRSKSIQMVKLISCEVPNIVEIGNAGNKLKISSMNSLASAIGSSRTLTTFDLTNSSLSTLACKELCASFYVAPVLTRVVLDQVCVPKDGRKSFLKLFADNQHLNQYELMLHSNDVYSTKNTTCKRRKKQNRNKTSSNAIKSNSGNDDYNINEIADTAKKASILSIVRAVGIREQHLVKLDVSNMKINMGGATSMASAIRNCFVLTYFNIADNNIGSVGANAIFQSLRRVLTLEELYIDNNAIGDSAAHAMATFVGEASCLRIFSLAENKVSNDGGSMIWSSIAKNSKMPLMSINFAGNKIDTAWCMSNAFRSSQYLESVNLSRNVLNQSSGRVFADAILPEKWGATRSLTSLDLGGNHLGVEGSTLIARAIRQSDRLRLLWLDNNKMGASGGLAIAKALKENESITMLDISNNMLALDVKRFSLDLHAVKELAAAVKVNKTLKFLYLKGNQIGFSGGKMLKESLQENKFIQSVDLKDNELPEKLQNDISMLLFTNARYSSAGVKANVSIKTNGNLIEIIDHNHNEDDNTHNHTNSNNMISKFFSKSNNIVSSQQHKPNVNVKKCGLPVRPKNAILADRKLLQTENRPSSPTRSTSRPTLSRPTPREKVMETLFLPGPESIVEDRLYHKIISPTNYERILLRSQEHKCHKRVGKQDATDMYSKTYQFEREDEFYASLVLNSRSVQNSPTRPSASVVKSGDNRNNERLIKHSSALPSSIDNSISFSSASAIDQMDDVSGDAISLFDGRDFKTTMPYPPSNDPGTFMGLSTSFISASSSISSGNNNFAPKLLFAGGHTALEEAAKVVSRDDSTGNGDVDVDALRRAMERMRNEMAQ